MIFLDELVSQALSAAGQVCVLPSDLCIDDVQSQTIFNRVVGEINRFRPPLRTLDTEINTGGLDMSTTDFQYLVALRRRGILITDLGAGIRYRRSPADHFTVDGKTIIAIPGLYRVEYAGTYALTYLSIKTIVWSPATGMETTASFSLNAKSVPGTVVLYRGVPEVSITDDGSGVFPTGSWMTAPGAIDYTSKAVSLTITASRDPIFAIFRTVNPGVEELSLFDEYFVDLFITRFLLAFATSKSLMQLDGTPFDLNRDALLDYIRGKEDGLKARLPEDKKWWMFQWLVWLGTVGMGVSNALVC